MKSIAIVSVISGVISAVIVFCLFWYVFPSAWLFFIIPAIMGLSIDKFGKIDVEKLNDDAAFNSITRKAGLLCAGMVLLSIIVCVLPLFLLMSFGEHLLNVLFYGVCAVSVYWGYNRGVKCVTNAYYDSRD